MVVSRSSFKTKWQEKNPRLIIFQCVSHSSAIVAKYACAKIPDVEDIVKDLPSFLNASSKRTAIFRSIVLELGYAFQKIPSHSETRWLVRHRCIIVILKNWEVILQFLMVLVSEKVEKAQELLEKMQNPLTFAYFLFLKFTLNDFNAYNAKFQSRETMVQELQPYSFKFFFWILGTYLKEGLLRTDLFFQIIRNVTFADSTNQKALETIVTLVRKRVYICNSNLQTKNYKGKKLINFFEIACNFMPLQAKKFEIGFLLIMSFCLALLVFSLK